MANLLNQNIGTNYRGILNLNTLNGNLSGTLQAVTDGGGNASPLQLSTTQAAFAGFSGAPDANIVWRANGTLTDYTGWHQSDGNFRIITKNAGALFININDGVNFSAGFSSTNRSSINLNGNWNIGFAGANLARVHVRGDGTNSILRLDNGAGTQVVSVNNSGLMTANGFQSINYSESFQRVGFNNGANFNALSYIRSSAAGVIILLDNSEAAFNRLTFGGTTNAFPALKRNGAALEVRLADDSGFADLVTNNALFNGNFGKTTSSNTGIFNISGASGNNGAAIFQNGIGNFNGFRVQMNAQTLIDDAGVNAFVAASAVLQLNSITRGFLPPRMTTTQKNAIASPAAGLVIFDTTLAKLCVYTTAWETITSI